MSMTLKIWKPWEQREGRIVVNSLTPPSGGDVLVQTEPAWDGDGCANIFGKRKDGGLVDIISSWGDLRAALFRSIDEDSETSAGEQHSGGLPVCSDCRDDTDLDGVCRKYHKRPRRFFLPVTHPERLRERLPVIPASLRIAKAGIPCYPNVVLTTPPLTTQAEADRLIPLLKMRDLAGGVWVWLASNQVVLPAVKVQFNGLLLSGLGLVLREEAERAGLEVLTVEEA